MKSCMSPNAIGQASLSWDGRGCQWQHAYVNDHDITDIQPMLRMNQPCPHFDLELPASWTAENTFLLFKLRVYDFCYGSPSRLKQRIHSKAEFLHNYFQGKWSLFDYNEDNLSLIKTSDLSLSFQVHRLQSSVPHQCVLRSFGLLTRFCKFTREIIGSRPQWPLLMIRCSPCGTPGVPDTCFQVCQPLKLLGLCEFHWTVFIISNDVWRSVLFNFS